MNTGFYVSSIEGSRKALMSGPYPTLDQALAKVDEIFKAVDALDPRAWFRSWGTCKLETASVLPIGNYDKYLAAKGAQ